MQKYLLREKSNFSSRQLLFYLALIVAGWLGNYFHLPLFYGIDFIFGSIAVMVIVRLYGTSLGVLASAIVASYTLFLWHQPYALLVLVLETLVVGLLLRRSSGSIFCLSGMYWLLLGMPLVWLFYFFMLHYDGLGASMLALKVGVNGFANALIAGLIIDHTPLRKWAGFADAKREIPLRQLLSQILVAFVVFPALTILLMDNWKDARDSEKTALRQLTDLSESLSDRLISMRNRQLYGLNRIARLLEEQESLDSRVLREELTFISEAVPEIGRIAIGDKTGRQTYLSGMQKSDGNAAQPVISYADSDWFQKLKSTRKPVVSGVFPDQESGLPSVVVSVPFFSKRGENQVLQGYIADFMKFSRIEQLLTQHAKRQNGMITLMDLDGRVIASTRPDEKVNQLFKRHASGTKQPISGEMYLWQPQENTSPALAMRGAYYALEMRIGDDIPRKIVAEIPVGSFQVALQQENLKALISIILIAIIAFLIGTTVSQMLEKPLVRLSRSTKNMAHKILAGHEEDLPSFPIREVNELVGNFREMAEALKQSCSKMQYSNIDLEERVNERTSELANVNQALQKTADALHKKEQEQATLLHNMPDLVCYKDSQSRYVFVNRAFEQTFGLHLEGIQGKTDEAIFGTEEAIGCQKDDQRARSSGEALVKEKAFVLKNGEKRIFHTTRTPLLGINGACTGTIGVFHDVTQLKKNQEKLTKTLSELEDQKFALDQHSIVSIADVNGHITYANEKFEEISGYSLGELIGSNHRILNSGFHPPAFWIEIWTQITQGKVWQGIICNRKKNGDYYWVDSTIVPFLDENNLPYQYVSIRTDFTSRKLAEDVIIKAKEEAEQANQAKSEFLSRMSHELRTPMNAILGFAQLMEHDPLNPLPTSQLENLHQILKGGWHLLELINEVLDLARVESGKMQVEITDTNVADLIVECIDMVAPLAAKRQIVIHVEKNLDSQQLVKADNTRLKQVLINLLSNAVKYNIENGSVNIVCTIQAGSILRINVSDTGKGLSLENQKLLFIPFSRLDADKNGIEGTGIGLVISKRMTELMGGQIGLHNAPGQGCTFWIELPLSQTA